MKQTLLAILSLLAASLAAQAAPDQFPLQLAICPPAQLMPEPTEIVGLKLNLPYGHNEFVRGFDLGIVGGATDCESLQVNAFNVVPGTATGIGIGLFNLVGNAEGIHIGLMNYVETECRGLHVGVLNVAQIVTGLQVGVVNRCDKLYGMQIGLGNIATEARLPFTVLINATF
jgi:hypothetical protein